MKKLFSSIIRYTDLGLPCVLVTVIGRAGSTPRDAGAQMLVTADGLSCGTIGGGEIELVSIQKAMEWICSDTPSDSKPQAFQKTYSLSKDSDDTISMVCGGEMTVYMQYIPGHSIEWKQASEQVIARLEANSPGWLLLSKRKSQLFLSDFNTPDNVSKNSMHASFGQDELYYKIPLPISERVIIFGAGHCAVPLCALLSQVGFRITVFDDRPTMAVSERFPAAERIICDNYTNYTQSISIDSNDYIVIMTSGHIHDYELEAALLPGEFAYLGVIGSRKKTAVINQLLKENGIPDEKIALVHTPIGLSIGAETPEEIAVSITAELIQHRAKRQFQAKAGKCPMHDQRA